MPVPGLDYKYVQDYLSESKEVQNQQRNIY